MSYWPVHYWPSTYWPIGYWPAKAQHGYRAYLRNGAKTAPDELVAVASPGSSQLVVGSLSGDSDQYLRVTAVSRCGVEDNERAKLVRARFDVAGTFIAPAPNAPSALSLLRRSGGAVEASWMYFANGQEAPPVRFNVYVAVDSDAFNFAAPEAQVNFSSSRLFTTTLGPFANGALVKVIVRSESAGAPGTQEPNWLMAQTRADAQAPAAPSQVFIEVEAS